MDLEEREQLMLFLRIATDVTLSVGGASPSWEPFSNKRAGPRAEKRQPNIDKKRKEIKKKEKSLLVQN